jgi:peptidoglycan/xylan/chitin deacetylase (PgdA/CDA1 family)
MKSFLCSVFLLSLLCAAFASRGEAAGQRLVAITFDDLPVATSVHKDEVTRRKITLRLLQSIVQREIPAIGFVNERGLQLDNVTDDEIDERRVDLLRLWLAAGLELGNHSFSHFDLHRTDLDEFKADVIRGQEVTSELLAERGQTIRYFRHPFLHTGISLDTKRDFEEFLTQNGYQVAPVTIDNSEWIFARAYDLALQAGDSELAEQIGSEYVAYILEMFEFYERQSILLFERNIAQVLLLHANELNSAWFGTLADSLGEKGYTFISLAEALQDAAYRSPDSYTGPGGITWLHRWAITRKVDPAMFSGEPETPEYILKLTELREHNYATDQ